MSFLLNAQPVKAGLWTDSYQLMIGTKLGPLKNLDLTSFYETLSNDESSIDQNWPPNVYFR